MRVFSCLVAMATLAIAADERALRDFVHSSTATVPRHVEGCSETDITIGSVVEGSLAITDCSLRLFNPGARIGLRTDAYKLVVESNLVIQVRMDSEQFEP